ncbi:uncharacterized protein LACBIDRAFT_330429 [Laccaria bicolor S238N-H82]|uniref:Predicted protein n=1 Tax=Laccaria bicolor (strain S238N-H82 / ATCC MYA-4686) TaxID=486041 RepID=B0DLA0_LACBS|nr:uncharacterized protein LACBIDRAFT_330429 [Laccaria bicolor S238N-H82]EDR04526.1 predicted protein [Laccaria bicolor S238N-H82]|eukprot:XP_001884698.1 predicted protein [Laccaria bicolor S238N-H82]
MGGESGGEGWCCWALVAVPRWRWWWWALSRIIVVVACRRARMSLFSHVIVVVTCRCWALVAVLRWCWRWWALVRRCRVSSCWHVVVVACRRRVSSLSRVVVLACHRRRRSRTSLSRAAATCRGENWALGWWAYVPLGWWAYVPLAHDVATSWALSLVLGPSFRVGVGVVGVGVGVVGVGMGVVGMGVVGVSGIGVGGVRGQWWWWKGKGWSQMCDHAANRIRDDMARPQVVT